MGLGVIPFTVGLTAVKVPYGSDQKSVLFIRTLLGRLPDSLGEDPLESAASIARLVIEIVDVRQAFSYTNVTNRASERAG